MLLYIIRHGDPDYAHDCLTPLGKRQAEAVGRRLASAGIDQVFTSPLGRAIETAQPLCEMLHLTSTVEDFVSENLAYSDMSIEVPGGGRKWIFRACPAAQFKSDENINLGISDWTTSLQLSRRDMDAAFKRIITGSDDFMARLGYARVSTAVYNAERRNTSRVAVFCHEGAGTTWMSHLLGIAPHVMWSSFSISHTSVSLFDFGSDVGLTVPQCLMLGDLSHIAAERLPFLHSNHVKI